MDGHTLDSGYRERNVSVKLNEAEYQWMVAIREEMRRSSRASNSDAIRYALWAIYETEAEAERRAREAAKRRRDAWKERRRSRPGEMGKGTPERGIKTEAERNPRGDGKTKTISDTEAENTTNMVGKNGIVVGKNAVILESVRMRNSGMRGMPDDNNHRPVGADPGRAHLTDGAPAELNGRMDGDNPVRGERHRGGSGMKGIIVTAAIALAAAIGGSAEAQGRPMPAECLSIESDGWPSRQRQRKILCAKIRRARVLSQARGCEDLGGRWERYTRIVIRATTTMGERPDTGAGKAALLWLQTRAHELVDDLNREQRRCEGRYRRKR